jgi:hypothetical protein
MSKAGGSIIEPSCSPPFALCSLAQEREVEGCRKEPSCPQQGRVTSSLYHEAIVSIS